MNSYEKHFLYVFLASLVILVFVAFAFESRINREYLKYDKIIDCYYKDKVPYCLVVPDKNFDF